LLTCRCRCVLFPWFVPSEKKRCSLSGTLNNARLHRKDDRLSPEEPKRFSVSLEAMLGMILCASPFLHQMIIVRLISFSPPLFVVFSRSIRPSLIRSRASIACRTPLFSSFFSTRWLFWTASQRFPILFALSSFLYVPLVVNQGDHHTPRARPFHEMSVPSPPPLFFFIYFLRFFIGRIMNVHR